MHEYIIISALNDFVFCPYSIYLHNVYAGGDEDLYHAVPQVKGKSAHQTIDNNTYSTRSSDITALSVFSHEFGLIGKIDLYLMNEKKLIERKHFLKTIYKGQIYQLWAQFFCMSEMGYEIKELAFYSVSTNTTFPIDIPLEDEKRELMAFLKDFRQYKPEMPITVNISKCLHCIYSNLCDKTDMENVYN